MALWLLAWLPRLSLVLLMPALLLLLLWLLLVVLPWPMLSQLVLC